MLGPTVSDSRESLVELVCDVDDMSPEYLAPIVERARDAGALDVALLAATMKHGRPGVRVELLVPSRTWHRASRSCCSSRRRRSACAGATSCDARFHASVIHITVLGHELSAKRVTLPDGRRRTKPEFADVQRVALATGQTATGYFQAGRR